MYRARVIIGIRTGLSKLFDGQNNEPPVHLRGYRVFCDFHSANGETATEY